MGNVAAISLGILGGSRAASKIDNTLKKVDNLVRIVEKGNPNHREKLYVEVVKEFAKG